jgi:hypothetical protein
MGMWPVVHMGEDQLWWMISKKYKPWVGYLHLSLQGFLNEKICVVHR